MLAGGGLLTAEELAEAKKHRPLGPLRDDGFEFVVSRTLFPVAYLETVVTLPQEYSPVVKPEIIVGNPTAGVTADDGGENSGAGEPGELARRVTELAPGQFSFQIPYPRPGVDYQIAWKPVTEATLDENTGNAAPRAAFAEAAQKRGAALLAAFGGPLLSRQPKGRWSIGLYLHNPQTATFKPLAVQPLGMDQLPSPLQPPAYDLTTCPVALATAWWGQDAMFRRPNGENAEERAKQLGFLDDELGLICLPVRFALRAVNPPPWGMVRAAALNPEAMTLLDPMNKDILGRALSAGMTALIAKGLAEA